MVASFAGRMGLFMFGLVLQLRDQGCAKPETAFGRYLLRYRVESAFLLLNMLSWMKCSSFIQNLSVPIFSNRPPGMEGKLAPFFYPTKSQNSTRLIPLP